MVGVVIREGGEVVSRSLADNGRREVLKAI
jgi:hypothetical protein